MNYFEKKQNIQWNTWSPENVIFKSNNITKRLLPKENVLSWTSKSDRDQKMCERTGCKAIQHSPYGGKPYTYYTKDNYKGIMVQLKDVKDDFPSANIDFIDWTERKDSVGNPKGHLDILIYLNSFHSSWDWNKCPKTGNWVKTSKGQIAPLREGYRMSYGGQGDAHAMDFNEFHELIQITEAVKDFLVDVVVPMKKGELCVEEYELMSV